MNGLAGDGSLGNCSTTRNQATGGFGDDLPKLLHTTMSDETVSESPQPQERPRKRSWFAAVIRNAFVLCLALMILVAAGLFGGFLRFSSEVSSVKPPRNITKVDAIVVLTGRSHRIEQALALLGQGVARHLLISGVNPSTTGKQLQKLTSTEAELFECCVVIGHDATDTEGNAVEVSDWATKNGFARLLVVTSSDHMPRSLIELRRVDPSITFVAYPVVPDELRNYEWIRRPDQWRVLGKEYAKYLLARIREATGADLVQPLRKAMAGVSEDQSARESD